MIQTLLVANRGEIACRVFRTCAELGIDVVAVHSDADAGALHVREALRLGGAAVRLPGNAPADTYLRGDLVVKAALGAGADAVHPGYGFLAESAEFARAVADAGLTWIGPPPAAIEAMASKTRAKELMGIPPFDPADATPDDLPLLVKAAAGGGGRGMRVVRELADLEGELTAASAEAASAFGDGEVFVEPYVENGRHVEVQVLADVHGGVWTLGTRDCSLQRRHQKVIEEAPAPGLPDGLAASLEATAGKAARAIGYVGAGTVEFLVGSDGQARFLEMNTRLQVEHPVTEAVYGVDLVALQLRIAEGAPLPAEPRCPAGHAVEARLYAEDPARDFTPQTGVLHSLRLAEAGSSLRPLRPLRVDAGYGDGDAVSPYYDALLAKVVAHGPTRAEAVRRLAHALDRARIHGPVTNRGLLVRSLRHEEFTGARMDTGFYDRHRPALIAPDRSGEALAALAAALADAAGRHPLGGWRNVPAQPQRKTYQPVPDGEPHEIRYRLTREGLRAEGFPGVRLLEATPHRVVLEADGVTRHFEVTAPGRTVPAAPGRTVPAETPHAHTVYVDSPLGSHALRPQPRFSGPAARAEAGSLLAPMPGTVVRVADGLAPGAQVRQGQPLLWLEAMKMEHKITAPASGTLAALHAAPGRQVDVGVLLAVIRADRGDHADQEETS